MTLTDEIEYLIRKGHLNKVKKETQVEGKQKADEIFTMSLDNIVKQKQNKLEAAKRVTKIKIHQ